MSSDYCNLSQYNFRENGVADKDLILETLNCEGAVKTSVTLYDY